MWFLLTSSRWASLFLAVEDLPVLALAAVVAAQALHMVW
jgi:hypothetical protein